MFGHMFPYDRFAQFWLCVHLVDVINCANFHLNQLRKGFRFCEGSKFTITVALRQRC